MTETQKRMMERAGVKSLSKPIPKTVDISRLEFDLLDMTYADTEYHIIEENGVITVVKGEY